VVLFRDGIGGVRRECVRSIGRAPRVEPEAAGIERFLTGGGGNTPPERLQVEAGRWIGLNWVRVGLIAISWWGALITLASHE